MPPTIIAGDLWSEIEHADMLLVTTNGTLKRDQGLVMGRGAALQAAARWPQLPYWLGREIHALGPAFWQSPDTGHAPYPYGLVFTYAVPVAARSSGRPLQFGAFQVKYHFRDRALPALIAQSALRLKEVIEMGYDASLPPRVAMNFPGTGFGRLTEAEIMPLLDPLPACVRVYRYGKER